MFIAYWASVKEVNDIDVVTRALETLRTRWLAMGMKLGQVLGAYLTVVHGVFCILYRTIAICSGVAVHV